jgi:hypothetical protein
LFHVDDSPVTTTPIRRAVVKGFRHRRFGGQRAVEEFARQHWISIQHESRDYAI